MIAMPPERKHFFSDDEDGIYRVSVDGPFVPNSCGDGVFTSDIELELRGKPKTQTGLAADAVTVIVVSAIHEAFEYVKVDGLRLAAPHPLDENTMWDELTIAVRKVVTDYITRWPREETTCSH